MRNSFVFYHSFYEAINELDAESYKQVMNALCHYQFHGELPELTGIAKAMFILIKPQLDANNRKRENGGKGGEFGYKGGRPKKPLENPYETPRKPLANPKITPNANVNANANVNVKEEKENYEKEKSDLFTLKGEPTPAITKMDIDQLPHAWRLWAAKEKGWDDLVINDTWSLFKDYWKHGKGKNTKRENWETSWRAWCRKENYGKPNFAKPVKTFSGAITL
jgi:hypothetical protein